MNRSAATSVVAAVDDRDEHRAAERVDLDPGRDLGDDEHDEPVEHERADAEREDR